LTAQKDTLSINCQNVVKTNACITSVRDSENCLLSCALHNKGLLNVNTDFTNGELSIPGEQVVKRILDNTAKLNGYADSKEYTAAIMQKSKDLNISTMCATCAIDKPNLVKTGTINNGSKTGAINNVSQQIKKNLDIFNQLFNNIKI